MTIAWLVQTGYDRVEVSDAVGTEMVSDTVIETVTEVDPELELETVLEVLRDNDAEFFVVLRVVVNVWKYVRVKFPSDAVNGNVGVMVDVFVFASVGERLLRRV